MSDAAIGLFDSGVGGLTVARAILDQLPNESTLYIGDTARGPYGPRPLSEVREFALETMDFLVDQGVKAIVIACNTASAAMLRDARERYSIPVIEVIQPAVRRAVSATRSGRIGVIGTQATIDSKAYLDAFAAAPQLNITSAACPLQDVIEDQTRAALAGMTSDVKINWVWMPPWGPDKISDDGRDQLRALGFTV